MKKKILLFVSIIVLFSPVFAQSNKSDGVDKEDFSSWFPSESELSCEYKDGQKVICRGYYLEKCDDQKLVDCYGIHPEGKILAVEVTYKEEKPSWKYYSNEGRLLGEQSHMTSTTIDRKGYYGQGPGGVRWEHIFEEADASPKVVKTFYENGQLESERLYEMVDNSREFSLVSSKSFDQSGNLSCENGVSLDGNTQCNETFKTECTSSDANGKSICRLYSLDRKLKSEKYLTNGKLYGIKTFHSNGQLKQSIEYNQYGTPISEKNYNETGKPIPPLVENYRRVSMPKPNKENMR